MFEFENLTRRDWVMVAAFAAVLIMMLYFGLHALVTYYAGSR